ncbi:hypothetical protein VNO80_33828 [Phaseolus coccineus]|uniref:Uncharacterized protein n=1 Tax=Phaseolus coccineus TaxID=3886 RepID=A0AAN9KZ52_PHACN
MRDQSTDREGNGLSIIGGPSLELNRSRSSQLSCLGSGIPWRVGGFGSKVIKCGAGSSLSTSSGKDGLDREAMPTLLVTTKRRKSGRRDLNPQPQPWQGYALPLSYFRQQRAAIGASCKESWSRVELGRPSFHSRNGSECTARSDKLLPRLAAVASVFEVKSFPKTAPLILRESKQIRELKHEFPACLEFSFLSRPSPERPAYPACAFPPLIQSLACDCSHSPKKGETRESSAPVHVTNRTSLGPEFCEPPDLDQDLHYVLFAWLYKEHARGGYYAHRALASPPELRYRFAQLLRLPRILNHHVAAKNTVGCIPSLAGLRPISMEESSVSNLVLSTGSNHYVIHVPAHPIHVTRTCNKPSFQTILLQGIFGYQFEGSPG